MVGEPVDRGLVDQRVDAGLLVEGEQLAGSLVAVSVHPWCGKAVGQCWQPCLRRGRGGSAVTGGGRSASCRGSPAPSAIGAVAGRPPPVGVSFAQNGGIFRIGITPRTDRPSSPWWIARLPVRRDRAAIGSGKTDLGAMPGIGPEQIADRRTDER